MKNIVFITLLTQNKRMHGTNIIGEGDWSHCKTWLADTFGSFSLRQRDTTYI